MSNPVPKFLEMNGEKIEFDRCNPHQQSVYIEITKVLQGFDPKNPNPKVLGVLEYLWKKIKSFATWTPETFYSVRPAMPTDKRLVGGVKNIGYRPPGTR
jgi:hypothetical protein